MDCLQHIECGVNPHGTWKPQPSCSKIDDLLYNEHPDELGRPASWTQPGERGPWWEPQDLTLSTAWSICMTWAECVWTQILWGSLLVMFNTDKASKPWCHLFLCCPFSFSLLYLYLYRYRNSKDLCWVHQITLIYLKPKITNGVFTVVTPITLTVKVNDVIDPSLC